MKTVKKLAVYLVGLAIIALGINFSKLSGLGISPVSSIPGVLNGKFPDLSLGNMIMFVYCILVLCQFAVLGKEFKPKNILGVPVAIVFGLITDFVGIASFRIKLMGIDLGINRDFYGLLYNFPRPQNLALRFVYLVASIIIIGIGVYIYLKPQLVPMPAEGLAQAISQKSGKAFGNCKTIVDVSMILIAAILQVILLGGFATLLTGLSDVDGIVGIGTALSAIFVGQVVKLIFKLIRQTP